MFQIAARRLCKNEKRRRQAMVEGFAKLKSNAGPATERWKRAERRAQYGSWGQS